MFGLNHGSADNKQRLHDGFGLTDAGVQDVIDSLTTAIETSSIAVWQGIDGSGPRLKPR